MSTIKDFSHVLRSDELDQKMNCHVALLTRKLILIYMCTNESNSHNDSSHCLQANSSLNHLLQYVFCNIACHKMVSPQYEFWSGFIDCFIEQMICNTVYKGSIFHFTSSSTPISSWTDTLSQSQACKGTTTRCPKNSFSPIHYFARK